MYSAISLIAAALLVVTIVDVCHNRLTDRSVTIKCIAVCFSIGLALLCEWVCVRLNGAPSDLTGLHRAVKTAEFCIAPVTGVLAAHTYSKIKKPTAIVSAIVALHAVFQIAACRSGLVLYLDEGNTYHRGRLYWIYIAVFTLSLAYCLTCVVLDEVKLQMRADAALVATVLFLAMGLTIQALDSDLRVDYLCIAIANLQLYNHGYRLYSRLDGLTMLLNRIRYEKDLERTKPPAVVINMDVNAFKQVNDTCGHAAGDRYLRQIAEAVRRVYGRYGYCYRPGGDEFCVILTESLSNVEKLNENFAAAIEKLRQQDPQTPDVSVGYARYDGGGTLHDAIEAADAMMYRNKS